MGAWLEQSDGYGVRKVLGKPGRVSRGQLMLGLIDLGRNLVF